MNQQNLSIIISALALGVSVASALVHLFSYLKTIFNLKIVFNKADSFYFDAIDLSCGNQHSLIVSVKIINNSNQPIMVSDFKIFNAEGSFSYPVTHSSYPYPSHLPAETFSTQKSDDGSLLLKSVHGDGYKVLDLSKYRIQFPVYLRAYESVEGLILFPRATETTKKTKFAVVTSRKDKTVSARISSKDEHENILGYNIR